MFDFTELEKMEHEDSDTDLDILNNLISNVDEETEQSEQNEQSKLSKSKKSLTEINFLDSMPSNINNENNITDEKIISEIYDDKLDDSSDDEDRRYFEEQKYSDYGRKIKQLLKKHSVSNDEKSSRLQNETSKTFNFNNNNKNKTFDFNNAIKNSGNNSALPKDVYSDSFFGIRIVNPLVSSNELKERMKGKIAVTVSKVKSHIISDNVHNDWVIAGVLINKSLTKTSQKGTSYCIWKISDLSDDLKTVSIFLFSNAYKQLWKTITGNVIGILNPNVLESKDNIDQATLSIDNPQKLMILGKSKDMGKCKSIKKNGDACTAIVNISRCEYCVYHVKQEYKKCARRADLQSSNTGQGFSKDALKRMNKQTAMRRPYNGLSTFQPILAVRNEKLYEKDRARLELLSEAAFSKDIKKVKNDIKSEISNPDIKKGISIELTNKQSKKDFERLNKLRSWQPSRQIMVQSTSNGSVLCSNATQLKESNSILTKSKSNHVDKKLNLTSLSSSPRLGNGCNQGTIDFSEPITKQQIYSARMNAIKWVQEHGKIKAEDRNQIDMSSRKKLEKNAKRCRETDKQSEQEEQRNKKAKSINEKFKEMLEAKSSHTDLIEKSYDKEKEKYFNKLEVKEKMEEKMMNTFKVNCKAVKCILCKYTAFSASDMCKEQRHPLRVIDAIKRFFKCTDCGNRTVSLSRMPLHNCGKCNSSNWAKAAMMDEKKIAIATETLCIRGTEEKFLGSIAKNANLNLLVPNEN